MTIDEHLSPADWALANWRKQDILQLRANGLTLHAIADLRGIAYSTVQNTQRKACRDLGANDPAHAIAIGFRLGLLE